MFAGIQFDSVWSRLIFAECPGWVGLRLYVRCESTRCLETIGVFPEITFFYLVGGSTLSCLDLKVLKLMCGGFSFFLWVGCVISVYENVNGNS